MHGGKGIPRPLPFRDYWTDIGYELTLIPGKGLDCQRGSLVRVEAKRDHVIKEL